MGRVLMGRKAPRFARRRVAVALVGVTAAFALASAPALAAQDEPGAHDGGPQATTIVSGGPAGAPKVLILDTSVTGGVSSIEAQNLITLGFAVDVADATSWASMTAPQFASYRAIVLGDPTCGSESDIAAAEANASTWGPVVNGNVIAIGTDPVDHYPQATGQAVLINDALAFATGQAGKTGLYADLSCYYNSSPTTAVPVLNAVESGWTTHGHVGCDDTIHVVATNPFLTGLTDADLSNWSCSVHEYFDAWPSDFIPIALDTSAPPLYTSSDGTQGSPYIIGRGAGLSASNILLSPDTQTLDAGATATLSALVQSGGTPAAGVTVTFTATSGPNAGQTGTAVTDSTGTATFTYTSAVGGTDTWDATFVDSVEKTETSNSVTVTWNGATAAAPPPVEIAPKFTG